MARHWPPIRQTPASFSLLHAHAVPPEGGETQFVDMRVATTQLQTTQVWLPAVIRGVVVGFFISP
jgi:alpha-ketoglutarate-dependent taurine dioxygenase